MKLYNNYFRRLVRITACNFGTIVKLLFIIVAFMLLIIMSQSMTLDIVDEFFSTALSLGILAMVLEVTL